MTHHMFSHYDPNRLFDAIISRTGLKGDKALSQKLKVARTVISRIRQKKMPIGASMLMWISEATGISIAELRRILGDRRSKYRLSYG